MRRGIPILLFIILALSVSAQDFNAFGDPLVTLNQCDAATRTLTIQNTADITRNYAVSIDGNGADFVAFSTLGFSLAPGQIEEITAFYTIPCDAKPDTYIADIYFDDSTIEKVIPQDLIVLAPDNINLTTTTQTAVIAPCETASFDLHLQNPRNQTEIYTLTAEGHDDVHLSEETVILEGFEEKTILLSVSPADCTESGSFKLKANIDAEKTSLHKEINLELLVKATDIPIIAEGISTVRTDYQESEVDLTIKNTGDRETTYDLALDGPVWASIAPNTVTLMPGQTQTAILRLAPTEQDAQATYPVTLAATVQATGIEYSKNFKIKLKPLSDYEKNPAPYIAGIIILIALLIGIIFLVRHTRTPAFRQKRAAAKARRALRKKEKIRARAQKKKEREQARARKKKERAQAREKKRKERAQRKADKQHAREKRKAERKHAREKKKRERYERKLKLKKQKKEQRAAETSRLKAHFERLFKKEYYLVSKKDVITAQQPKRSWKTALFWLVVLVLVILGRDVLAANVPYVMLGIAILLVLYLGKKLSESRSLVRGWKLFSAGTKTVRCWKTGLTSLAVSSKKALKGFKVQIKKKRAHTPPSAFVYQQFAVKTNITNEPIGMKASIAVSKHWMHTKQLQQKDLRVGRYHNQHWQTLSLSKTSEDKENIYFAVDLKGDGQYGVYAKPTRKIHPRPRLFWYVAVLAIIIGIALVLAPQGTNTVVRGIPAQTWQQDKLHNLDLSTYFTDPDHDVLQFTATPTEHILIEIRGNTAYFTPETGWIGEELVRFTADDGKGGVVESNSVKLQVKKNLIPASAQPVINIIIGILAVLMLLFVVRDLGTRKR